MRGKRSLGLVGYALAVWGVLLVVAALIGFSALRDVARAGESAGGAFLYIGLPIFVLGLAAPVLFLKALSRWSRDIEGDTSEFRLRDVPKDEPPRPVSPAPPQTGAVPPVGTTEERPPGRQRRH
jgi:hypothetical protein